MQDDTPENDAMGVKAAIRSSVNLAGVEGWPLIMAREVDAMCNHLVFDHREPYSFDSGAEHSGIDWMQASVRDKAKTCLMDEGKKCLLQDAWKEVAKCYATRNSHNMYECHLPSFIPLAAVDKICISSHLYEKHSDIRNAVQTLVLNDGRRLQDIVHKTDTPQECMDWQQSIFDKICQRHMYDSNCYSGKAKIVPPPNVPISLYLAGQAGRPVFLPPDFGAWHLDQEGQRQSELSVCFSSRAGHDIRVFFSSTAKPQNEKANLGDNKWCSTTYHICLGASDNTKSYITKGILGTRHSVHVQCDPHACCSAVKESNFASQENQSSGIIGIWEQYWFRVQLLSFSGKALVSCGRGLFGTNTVMEFVDDDPIKGLKYVGLGCWNEPTFFCNVAPIDKASDIF